MENPTNSTHIAQRLAAIVDSSEDAIISKDLHSIVMSWNAGAERMFGYTAEEMIGTPVMRIIPKDRQADEVEILERVRNGERFEHFETVRLAKDGRRIDVSISVSPIKDAEGRIIGASKIARDITSQKQAQEDLRKAALEKQQLLERERAARAEAEKAIRVKDDFLATLSHELRTPLNAILGWSSLLTSGAVKGEEMTMALNTIERNARAQAQIIEDLLDMSRIVLGKVQLDMAKMEVDRVLADAVEAMQNTAQAKGLALEASIAQGEAVILGDAVRMKQVFWNLLTNAIKFTPAGGRVTVKLEHVGILVRVSVKDSGEGIDADFLATIFNRFEQADTSITRRHGGLGLGLSIVRQLVELHGGKVWAESEGVGKGAAFFVELPLVNTPALKPEEAPTDGSRGLREPPGAVSLEGRHILVVDDDEDGRQVVERLLAGTGAKISSANSASAGMEALLSHPVDLLVCDIGMPGEDGYSFIRRIRKLDDWTKSEVPAVALTAYARMEDRTEAIRSGFQNHVSKPVEAVELLAVVNSLASERGRRQRAELAT